MLPPPYATAAENPASQQEGMLAAVSHSCVVVPGKGSSHFFALACKLHILSSTCPAACLRELVVRSPHQRGFQERAADIMNEYWASLDA